MDVKRVVVVTGAAKGIGKTIASEYGKKGYQVILTDTDEETGRKNAEKMQEDGQQCSFIKMDVRVPKEIAAVMGQIFNIYGRIDILINNAGKTLWKSPYEVSVEEWDDLLNTNLRSVFLVSREAAKYMRKNKNGGAIVNMASTRYIMSEPNTELYAASKGGIVSITHALASSLSQDLIRVNAISPGWIETGDYEKLSAADHEQHFSRRVGKPEDIAKACLYLTDEDNDFITGTNIVIDGGMTKKMIYVE